MGGFEAEERFEGVEGLEVESLEEGEGLLGEG